MDPEGDEVPALLEGLVVGPLNGFGLEWDCKTDEQEYERDNRQLLEHGSPPARIQCAPFMVADWKRGETRLGEGLPPPQGFYMCIPPLIESTCPVM